MFCKLLSISFICAMLSTAANSQSAEVHAVAVYEGVVRTDGNVHGPEARVTLNRPDANVNLVLGSYDPVRWIVEASTQTNINMIYVHGYNAGRSEVLLNGTPFAAERLNIRSTHRNQGSRFRSLVSALSAKFDVPRLTSFHGAYTAPSSPFLIDGIQQNAVNDVDYLKVKARPEALTESLRQFLAEETEPIARLTENGFYLRKDGEEQHFPVTLEVPTISRPGKATYDPVNQRLYAGTAWHVGFFYSYDILTDRWSAIEQPRGMKVDGVIYDLAQDRFILGVENRMRPRSSRLIAMSTSGEMTEIDHDVFVGLSDLEDVGNGPAATLIPLAVDGDFLLARGRSASIGSTAPGRYRTYLIDLVTGHVTLADLSD